MKALLLAAGMGSRLRPLTACIPKCMVHIDGRPLLDYWMELLGPTDICDEIIINTHYLPEPVRKYVDQSPYRSKITLVHEEVLLGTGGTLLKQLPRLQGRDALIAHADNLTLFHLSDFQLAFEARPQSCVATMMTFKTDSPQSCGIVELDDKGVVQGFHEKVADPPGNLANAAVFLLGVDALAILGGFDPRSVVDISLDVVPRLVGRLNTWQNAVYHRDIGSPESLALAQAEFPIILEKFKGTR